jgi:hypothetical protein
VHAVTDGVVLNRMSTNAWTEETVQTALQGIVKRATSDAEFRKLVLDDPAAAVREATGKSLPEGFVINVVANDGADWTVVLPDAIGDSELSDSQLEGVAGGCGKVEDPEEVRIQFKDDRRPFPGKI